VNWRAFICWLVFSALWAGILFGVVRRWPPLCIVAGALLGFLTLCGVDIFQANRQQRSLRDECDRKRRFETGDQS
jgi:membrane-associated phospholipid phosphatase